MTSCDGNRGVRLSSLQFRKARPQLWQRRSEPVAGEFGVGGCDPRRRVEDRRVERAGLGGGDAGLDLANQRLDFGGRHVRAEGVRDPLLQRGRVQGVTASFGGNVKTVSHENRPYYSGGVAGGVGGSGGDASGTGGLPTSCSMWKVSLRASVGRHWVSLALIAS